MATPKAKKTPARLSLYGMKPEDALKGQLSTAPFFSVGDVLT